MQRVVAYPLAVDNETWNITALRMGNPHCCIFVDDFDSVDWRRLGRVIESHPLFPEKTNVMFIRVIDRDTDRAAYLGTRRGRDLLFRDMLLCRSGRHDH